MSLKKLDSGKWLLNFRPAGTSGKQIKKQFGTKAEALRFKALAEAEAAKGNDWVQVKDNRKLSELINVWFMSHGQSLKDGASRQKVLLAMCANLGDPIARLFTAKDFSAYRDQRLLKVTPNTINHEHAYLRAVFNELIRLDDWPHANPLEKLRLFKIDETELSFLDFDQISTLFDALAESRNSDATLVTKVCLATGARWSEAESLRNENLHFGKVTFSGTKSGKNRSVPLPNDLYAELKKRKGKLFSSCYSAFREAVTRSGLKLPEGQLTHVLRHTFASHFMMNGGNILVLQRVLGHADIKMTMRYSHFSPSHLDDVVTKNPFSMWEECGNSAKTGESLGSD